MLRIISIILVSIALVECATVRKYPNYTNWDLNGDSMLNRYEFLTGYTKSNYFLRWGGGKLAANDFIRQIFNAMDHNKDTRLTCEEFHSKVDYYFHSSFNNIFYDWDDNRDNVLVVAEFEHLASQTELTSHWDTTSDNKLSEREIAVGMFYLSDVDHNKSVDLLEFNIWKVNR